MKADGIISTYKALGRNRYIKVKDTLINNNTYPRIINENVLSALNNYLKKEQSEIYITPFNDLLKSHVLVSVFNRNTQKLQNMFSLKIEENGKNFAITMKKLYNKVADAIKNMTLQSNKL